MCVDEITERGINVLDELQELLDMSVELGSVITITTCFQHTNNQQSHGDHRLVTICGRLKIYQVLDDSLNRFL